MIVTVADANPAAAEQRCPRPAARKGRIVAAVALAAAVGIFAAMALPACLGRVYLGDDLGAFHLPARDFYARQLARGQSAAWWPDVFCGYELAAEGQAGTFHPLHWGLYRWLPLRTAFCLELLLSYPLMLAGMWLLLRRWLRPGAAAGGAVWLAFSGFMLLHFVHPNAVAVVAHLPWLLWLLDGLLRRRAMRPAPACLAVALLTGSQILLGYPQYVWFSLVVEGLYAAWLVGRMARRTGFPTRPCLQDGLGNPPYGCGGRQLVLGWTAAKALGVALAAVQLLPTVTLLGQSVRAGAEAAFAGAGSLHPLNLLQLLSPYLLADRVVGGNTHEFGIYCGAVPLVLAAWLVLERRRLGRLRGLALAAAALGLLGILMALGDYGVLYRLQTLVPWIKSFRFPCRYVLLVHFSAAVLAAVALGMLIRWPAVQSDNRRLGALWAIPLAAVVLAATAELLGDSAAIGPALGVWAGPALLTLAVFLVRRAARGSTVALGALVLFSAADLGYYGLSYAIWPGTARLEEKGDSPHLCSAPEGPFRQMGTVPFFPPGSPGPRVVYDLLQFDQPGLRSGNQATMAGWRRADGYAGLEPRRQLDYGCVAALRVAGVGWVRRGPSTQCLEGAAGITPYDAEWLQVAAPLGRARLVTLAVCSADPASHIARIPLKTAALVERPLELDAAPAGTASVVSDEPGRIVIETHSPGRALLVVNERFARGWTAAVNGQPGEPLRVNGDFLGCPVEAGTSRVVLEYQSPSIRAGARISLAALALWGLLAAGAWAGSRRRRASPAAQTGTAPPPGTAPGRSSSPSTG